MDTGDVLSVVVPSWREGPRLLEAVRAARMALEDAEFVVVAFDESREVRDAARAEGVIWVDAPRANRGLQLKLGAERARNASLVFLHADTHLPKEAGRQIRAALATAGVAGGAFRLRFDRTHPVLDTLARLSRLTLPAAFLGDQCMFCSREAYDLAGGVRPEPLFEDVDLARRLARVGRLVRLPEAVTTSSRRFASNGPFRQLAKNALLFLGYQVGVSPRRLSAVYQPNVLAHRSLSHVDRRTGLGRGVLGRTGSRRERTREA